MKTFQLVLWIWPFIAGRTYADSFPVTNAPALITLTNVVMSTNIVTLPNTVTLANTVTQILPANQTSGVTSLVAIISACIAVIAVFFAVQQFLLAKEKFRLDMFEKRYAIYKAISSFIYELIIDQTATMDSIKKLNHDTETAEFLFDDRIIKLISQLKETARHIIFVRKEMEADTTGRDIKKNGARHDLLWEQVREMESMLAVEFESYLQFHNWKYGLIWPKKRQIKLDIVKDNKKSFL